MKTDEDVQKVKEVIEILLAERKASIWGIPDFMPDTKFEIIIKPMKSENATTINLTYG